MPIPDPTRARLEQALENAIARRDEFRLMAERELAALTYHADQLQALLSELDAPPAAAATGT